MKTATTSAKPAAGRRGIPPERRTRRRRRKSAAVVYGFFSRDKCPACQSQRLMVARFVHESRYSASLGRLGNLLRRRRKKKTLARGSQEAASCSQMKRDVFFFFLLPSSLLHPSIPAPPHTPPHPQPSRKHTDINTCAQLPTGGREHLISLQITSAAAATRRGLRASVAREPRLE